MEFSIWHYLSGYVIIEIKGKYLERFINRVVQSGGDIWRVRRIGTQSVRACVSIGTFYAMRPLLRQCGVRLSIISKHGLLMLLSKLRMRKVLLYGWIIVLALLIAASRRIWFIDITGCDNVPAAQLLAALNEMGVNVGSLKSSLAVHSLGQRIMAGDERIAWAGASINGVVLNVKIAEADNSAPQKKSNEPQSLYAAKDGIITELIVLNGKAMVRPGDAVTKGQELISGIMRNDELGFITAAAEGTAKAKVGYVFTAKVGPALPKQVCNGNAAHYNAISLFGFSFADEPEYSSYFDELEYEYTFSGCILPLKIEKRIRRETSTSLVQASLQELQYAACLAAEQELLKAIPHSAVIISKQTRYEQDADGAVSATIAITTQENIAQAGGIVLYGNE